LSTDFGNGSKPGPLDPGLWFRVDSHTEFKVQRFRVQRFRGSGFRGSGFKVQGSRFRGSGFPPSPFGLRRAGRVQGSGFRGSKVIFKTNPAGGKKTAGLIEKQTLILCYRSVGHRADQYRRLPAVDHRTVPWPGSGDNFFDSDWIEILPSRICP
jgi:hypothetical protein